MPKAFPGYRWNIYSIGVPELMANTTEYLAVPDGTRHQNRTFPVLSSPKKIQLIILKVLIIIWIIKRFYVSQINFYLV